MHAALTVQQSVCRAVDDRPNRRGGFKSSGGPPQRQALGIPLSAASAFVLIIPMPLARPADRRTHTLAKYESMSLGPQIGLLHVLIGHTTVVGKAKLVLIIKGSRTWLPITLNSTSTNQLLKGASQKQQS